MDPGIKIIGNVLRDASIIILVNYSLQKRADTVGTAVLVFKFSLLIPSLYTRNPIFLQNRLSMNIVKTSGIWNTHSNVILVQIREPVKNNLADFFR